MKILKAPGVILGTYLGSIIVKVVLYLQRGHATPAVTWVRILELPVFGLIAVFAARRAKWALWITGIYLILTNIWPVRAGLFLIEWEQYVVKPVWVVLGSYFIFGGIILVRQARER